MDLAEKAILDRVEAEIFINEAMDRIVDRALAKFAALPDLEPQRQGERLQRKRQLEGEVANLVAFVARGNDMEEVEPAIGGQTLAWGCFGSAQLHWPLTSKQPSCGRRGTARRQWPYLCWDHIRVLALPNLISSRFVWCRKKGWPGGVLMYSGKLNRLRSSTCSPVGGRGFSPPVA
ncbi:MAG: hypothetical protein KJ720_18105 [Proteobacteria bacterium]|nr:hypothetical protein [Pseudomonadota bacterium]MBU1449379.1 hypothetical protein [Pseudomonadota bacterium]MBU2467937.1 hypothetical protein [Pseudomonadota bacterium]MBU2518309.1 hypothetical protein [Pseudomonadota bacterium]